MAFSNLLQILLIAENQNDKYQTHNDGIAALEQAGNAIYKNTTAGDIAVSKSNAQRYRVFKFSGAAAAQIITFPSKTDTLDTVNTQREFIVWNASSFDYTIKASSGTGTSFVLKAGHVGLFYQDFEDIACLSDTDTSNVLGAYDIGFFIPSKPNDNVNGLVFSCVRPFKLPIGLAGSKGAVGVNPTSAATLTIKKNTTTIGTINISALGVVTFTFSAAVSFAAGDVLSVITPTPQDATLEDVSVTFMGTRS
jgi:hypothetical protein